MSGPVRIQLSRKAGFRLQRASFERNGLPAVVVTRSGRFGNPYKVGATKPGGVEGKGCLPRLSRECTLRLFQDLLAVQHRKYPSREDCVAALRGHNLACWCPLDQPCHADLLLEYVKIRGTA